MFNFFELIELPKYIAHACGNIDECIYSNSYEAFMHSYHQKGHRFFEIDINLASDGEFILIHDFAQTYEYLFKHKLEGELSSEIFKQLSIWHKYQTLTLKDFCHLAEEYSDIYIVSDCKLVDNLAFLGYVKQYFPHLQKRFIIQAYHLYELPKILELGFKYCILTNYRNKFSFTELYTNYQKYNLQAVAFGKEIIGQDLLKQLKDKDCNIILHTFNDLEKVALLAQNGINSFFTDFLY